MIETEKINGEYGLEKVSQQFVAMFESMDNEYLRERAADIKDVSRRVLMHMKGLKSHDLSEINSEVILVARDLTPSDTAQLNRRWVKGFVTDIGGRTSHSAIMARTLEIPAVVGTMTGFESLKDGEQVILDGMKASSIRTRNKSDWKNTQRKYKSLNAKRNCARPI